MAGIGVKLNNIYGKNTLTTDVIGMGYSTVMTIAPMLTVIGALCIMEYFLDFSSVGYVTRELFSCTVLYIFIFALLTASPFNSVLSKYMSDVIYEETYADIMACYYVGLFLNILLSSLVGIPFCIHLKRMRSWCVWSSMERPFRTAMIWSDVSDRFRA